MTPSTDASMPLVPTTGRAAPWQADSRSLSAVRVGLGAFLLFDALARLAGAGALYSDLGLLPRDAALALLHTAQWSLHLVNGSALFASLLMLLQGVAAAALMLGVRNHLATWACWALAISAATRNPLAVVPADAYAIVLLSWALLRGGWPVAHAGRPAPERTPQTHPADLGLWLSVLLLPVLCALTVRGTALAPAALITAAALVVSALLPAPGYWPRRFALLLYLCGALALWMAGGWGPLPALAMLASLLLVDPGLWHWRESAATPRQWRLHLEPRDSDLERDTERLLRWFGQGALRRVSSDHGARVQRLFDGGARLVLIDDRQTAHRDADAVLLLARHSLPGPALRPFLGSATLRRKIEAWIVRSAATPRIEDLPVADRSAVRPANVVLCTLLGLAVLLSQGRSMLAFRQPAATMSNVSFPYTILAPLALHLSWLERRSDPGVERTWLVVVGEAGDGRLFDALSRPADPLPPVRYGREQAALAPGLRGRRYVERLMQPTQTIARAALARSLCERHRGQLRQVRLVQVVQAATPASAPAEQRILDRHGCAEGRPGAWSPTALIDIGARAPGGSTTATGIRRPANIRGRGRGSDQDWGPAPGVLRP